MKNLVGKCRSALDKYQMIDNHDKIAVGVSGGKDSMVLLYLLCELKKYYPLPFDVVAVTVDPGFSKSRTDFCAVTSFCNQLGIEHVIKRTELYNIIFERRQEENPCSLCARMRRGIIHNVARENGCNKVALGHNRDDAVETFFMNLLNGGQLGCFSPKSYLSRKDLWLIRPLVFCSEHEIRSLATQKRLPIVKSACPVDGKTQRQHTKELISSIETQYTNVQKKVLGAMMKNNLSDW